MGYDASLRRSGELAPNENGNSIKNKIYLVIKIVVLTSSYTDKKCSGP